MNRECWVDFAYGSDKTQIISLTMKLRERSSPRRREQSSVHPTAVQCGYEETNGKKSRISYVNKFNSRRVKVVLVGLFALVLLQSTPRRHLNGFRSTSNNEYKTNPFALTAGELPGYTGWARPEQTLAGYFHIDSASHSSKDARYRSIVQSGDKFTLLLTCTHNGNSTYICPSSGTLFYVRAYGPSVITGNVTDHFNSSYSVELYPVETGEYTVEVVVTFSAPLELHEFPLGWNVTSDEDEEEPGYEGYLVSGFPISILVQSRGAEATKADDTMKQWCSVAQLTEQSPISSLTAGHWQVIDHVGNSNHHPLTPDDTLVSLDGYRMGLNSIGVRMQYQYEECELIHIRDIVGDEETGHIMDRCLLDLGYLDEQTVSRVVSGNKTGIINHQNDFHGLDVIFIGDSVMKLEMGFFIKLLGGSGMVDGSRGINITFIETNGGLQATLPAITSTLNSMQAADETRQSASKTPSKRVIMFNSGLHDIDILCSSKRKRTRNDTSTYDNKMSCADAYQNVLKELVQFIDTYPAELKVFRTTTAGWAKV